MKTVIDILEERGFVEAMTHEEELKARCAEGPITCYIGFDPTASSLHVGSLVPIMSLAHMQRSGHAPIALMGGGTGLVGDPSGKTEMRQLISEKDVDANVQGIKKQLSNFIDFDTGSATLVNNADWLRDLHYIPFLRDIGRHFSVNRMIKAESYKMRLDSEEGLSFIEFNYMLLQAYDFLKLYESRDCRLQMGGSDQWGNIVAGIDLVRRVAGGQTYGLTFPLITTSSGAKMGKTAAGAIWLDPERTSPYEYYQYWINTNDADVIRFLFLYTFLPAEEIGEVARMQGADINSAKTVLAFEATRIAHGEEEAVKAHRDTISHFGGRKIPAHVLPSARLHGAVNGEAGSVEEGGLSPQTEIVLADLAGDGGLPVVEIFQQTGLAASKGAARRLIQQGGAYVNGNRVDQVDGCLTPADIQDNKVILRAGKKKYHTLVIRDA